MVARNLPPMNPMAKRMGMGRVRKPKETDAERQARLMQGLGKMAGGPKNFGAGTTAAPASALRNVPRPAVKPVVKPYTPADRSKWFNPATATPRQENKYLRGVREGMGIVVKNKPAGGPMAARGNSAAARSVAPGQVKKSFNPATATKDDSKNYIAAVRRRMNRGR